MVVDTHAMTTNKIHSWLVTKAIHFRPFTNVSLFEIAFTFVSDATNLTDTDTFDAPRCLLCDVHVSKDLTHVANTPEKENDNHSFPKVYIDKKLKKHICELSTRAFNTTQKQWPTRDTLTHVADIILNDKEFGDALMKKSGIDGYTPLITSQYMTSAEHSSRALRAVIHFVPTSTFFDLAKKAASS